MYDPRATMARMTLQDVLDFGAPEVAGSFGELAAGVDTFLEAEEAKAFGIVDQVFDKRPAPADAEGA